MAGATIRVDDREVLSALSSLAEKSQNLHPAFKEIGEQMQRNIDKRFADGVAPDGTPWAQNSAATLAAKDKNGNPRKHGDRPLINSGDLRGLIRYDASDKHVEIGSDRGYAAMMQFGGTKAEFSHLWGDIPARPFLGLSNDDEADILQIVNRYLNI